MGKRICISGSPCTGKKNAAKLLSKFLKYKILDLKKIIKENKLVVGYDKKLRSDIINEKKLIKKLVEIIKKSKDNLIITSHLSHLIPVKYVDICIITKCDLKELKKRLEKRKYSKEKIDENLNCEIFDVCLNEAYENKHKVLIVNTSKKGWRGWLKKEVKKI
jgi:adenylate kinase